jgi:hypothetical protein
VLVDVTRRVADGGRLRPKPSPRIGRVAATILCGTLLGAACGGSSGDSTTLSNPPTTAAPTTQVPQAVSEIPPSACCDGVAISAGIYKLPDYWGIPLTVAIQDGWRAVYDNSAVLMAFVQGQNRVADPSRWLYLIRAPEGLTSEDVITAMAAMDSIISTSDAQPVELAGFAGFQFDATAKHDPEQEEAPANGIEAGAMRLDALNDTGYFPSGFIAITATRESAMRFVALETGDRTMLALIDAPPDEFEAFSEEAMEILASMSTQSEG